VIKIIVNGEVLEVSENCTLSGLVEQLELVGKKIAIELNMEIIPRSLHHETRLHNSDNIEVVQAIGGG